MIVCTLLVLVFLRASECMFFDGPECNRNNHNYKALLARFKNPNECTDNYEVFKEIRARMDNDEGSRDCIHQLAADLAAHFGSNIGVNPECTCSGNPRRHSYTGQYGRDSNCYKYDRHYQTFLNYYYSGGSQHSIREVCVTHRSVWGELSQVSYRHSSRHPPCELVVVRDAADAYQRFHGDGCECKSKAAQHATHAPATLPTTTTTTTTTTKPTTTTTTTKATTTTIPTTVTTTTKATTTTTVPIVFSSCDKFKIIEKVGQQVVSTSANATQCADSSQGSADAFVLNVCNTKPLSTWTRGKQIMSDCSSIPAYTPIAAFPTVQYNPQGNNVGVFIKCDTNGFEMALQICGYAPELRFFYTNGTFLADANNYYTIN